MLRSSALIINPKDRSWLSLVQVALPPGAPVFVLLSKLPDRVAIEARMAGLLVVDVLLVVRARKSPLYVLQLRTRGSPPGRLAIDRCRIGDGSDKSRWIVKKRQPRSRARSGPLHPRPGDTTLGRWPMNVILMHDGCGRSCRDACPARQLDSQGVAGAVRFLSAVRGQAGLVRHLKHLLGGTNVLVVRAKLDRGGVRAQNGPTLQSAHPRRLHARARHTA